MKKFISILILMAVLLSLCACNDQQAETPTEANTDLLTPEDMFGHIDQNAPSNGVFEIWSVEGLQNMSQYPDADIKILCNIDAQGAIVAPLGSVEKPFTGSLAGGNFIISNFVLEGGADGAFGFLGVNKGKVENLTIENVTFRPDAKATNIGTFAGINEGTINRCSITGNPMELSQVPENANCGSVVGTNSGTMRVVQSEVDLTYTASVKANVGGIAGLIKGGELEYVKSLGKLVVNGSANSGLYAGHAENAVLTGCVFLGAENSRDGKLFVNFSGTETEMSYPDCLFRDNDREPLPENVQKVRQLAVDHMYNMGTIEWHVDQELLHYCKCGTSGNCDGTYMPGWTYYGLPYKHGNGSLTSMQYVLDENGYMKDFIYDMEARNGFDTYIGAMCSSASQMGWWRVSNSVDHMVCLYMLPDFPEYGCIPVGTGWYENAKPNSRYDTDCYTKSCTDQVFFEALALTRPGDCVVNGLEVGDHVRMVAYEPVVVRDINGNIDGNESYLITHECSGKLRDEVKMTETNWRIDWHYSFENLRGEGYVPVTIEELLTGEMEPGECKIVDGADGKLGMTVGTVKGNYFLESVTLKINDAEGNVILDKVMFPKAGKFNRGNTRMTSLAYIDYFDLAQFKVVLQDVMLEPGKTYSYSISAHLACDEDFLLKEDSFTQGQL